MVPCVCAVTVSPLNHASIFPDYMLGSPFLRWQGGVILPVVLRRHFSHPVLLLDVAVVRFSAFIFWQEQNAKAVIWIAVVLYSIERCLLTRSACKELPTPEFCIRCHTWSRGQSSVLPCRNENCSWNGHSACSFSPWEVLSFSVTVVTHMLGGVLKRTLERKISANILSIADGAL